MEQQDEIKQLLQVNDQKSQGSVRIESDILEPQSSSQSHAVFTLRKAGILSNDSRLMIPLYASTANTRLTCFGGAYSIIRRATLRTSDGNVIAQTDDANYLASIKNHFKKQEFREKVGKYKNGTYNIYQYTANGQVGLKPLESRDLLGTSAEDRVEYVISLGELFPELMPFSIPLFALEGQVQLALDFSDDCTEPAVSSGDRAVPADGQTANIGNVKIDLDNFKFISDHVFMDQDVFDRIIALTRTPQGLVIPYGDYQVIQTAHAAADPAPAANAKTLKKYNDNIGMSGLRLKHLFVHNSLSADVLPTRQKITGRYGSTDSYAGVDGQSLQININNENYYNQDLPTQEWYRELNDVYGTAPAIPYPLYTTIGSVSDSQYQEGAANTLTKKIITDVEYYTGVAQNLSLTGQACIGAVNFCNPLDRSNTGQNGVQVGNSPISVQYNRYQTATLNEAITTRYFACIERLMAIKNGKIENNFS